MPLLSGKTNQFSLILYTSYPSPGINHLSNKHCFLLGETGIQRPYSEYQEGSQLLSCSPFSMLFRGQRSTTWSFFKRIFKLTLFISFFLAVLGLRYCAGFSLVVVSGATSSCNAQASHCSGFSRCRARAQGAQAQQLRLLGSKHGLNSRGTQAWLFRCMGDLPRSGIELCLLHWQVDS